MAAPPAEGFWFNVNAELIIYGATEPTAKVTLDGREIKCGPTARSVFALRCRTANTPAHRGRFGDGAESRTAD